jgi:hypothetical protein
VTRRDIHPRRARLGSLPLHVGHDDAANRTALRVSRDHHPSESAAAARGRRGHAKRGDYAAVNDADVVAFRTLIEKRSFSAKKSGQFSSKSARQAARWLKKA